MHMLQKCASIVSKATCAYMQELDSSLGHTTAAAAHSLVYSTQAVGYSLSARPTT